MCRKIFHLCSILPKISSFEKVCAVPDVPDVPCRGKIVPARPARAGVPVSDFEVRHGTARAVPCRVPVPCRAGKFSISELHQISEQ